MVSKRGGCSISTVLCDVRFFPVCFSISHKVVPFPNYYITRLTDDCSEFPLTADPSDRWTLDEGQAWDEIVIKPSHPQPPATSLF